MPLWHRRVYQTNCPTHELWTKSKTQLSEGSAGQLQIGRNQEGGDTRKHQGVDFAFFLQLLSPKGRPQRVPYRAANTWAETHNLPNGGIRRQSS